MNRYFRYLMVLFCAVQIGFTLAFLLQMPFATQLWPLPDTTPMSFIFIASIFAAAAASTLWCLAAREDGALAGVALDYVCIFAPVTIFGFQLAGLTGNNALIPFSIVCGLTMAFGIGLFLWSVRVPMRDTRPMPRLIRASFAFFVIALIVAGGALILKTPNILPWRVTPELGVMSGWFFLGAAAYFTYSLVRPGWPNTAGQLAGFLAYDVVLIIPFLQRLPTIAPELQISLYIYIIVVVYSGLLAIYYLFVNRGTRIMGGKAS
jgi:heme/copper-type cytochrome/quinol oxidase subunit 4